MAVGEKAPGLERGGARGTDRGGGAKPILALVAVAVVASVLSGIRPYDYWTWFFEIVIGWAGVALLVVTYGRFRFSNLIYLLAGIHFVILAAGARYTYAEMPLFNWLRDHFGLSRNYYDRVGHFMQGFVPALVARELLVRTSPLRPGKWVASICVAFALAISAFYEFIEWWTAAALPPKDAADWLGMQGDMWDAQGDMLMAFTGAIIALLLLSRLHNRSMRAVGADV